MHLRLFQLRHPQSVCISRWRIAPTRSYFQSSFSKKTKKKQNILQFIDPRIYVCSLITYAQNFLGQQHSSTHVIVERRLKIALYIHITCLQKEKKRKIFMHEPPDIVTVAHESKKMAFIVNARDHPTESCVCVWDTIRHSLVVLLFKWVERTLLLRDIKDICF